MSPPLHGDALFRRPVMVLPKAFYVRRRVSSSCAPEEGFLPRFSVRGTCASPESQEGGGVDSYAPQPIADVLFGRPSRSPGCYAPPPPGNSPFFCSLRRSGDWTEIRHDELRTGRNASMARRMLRSFPGAGARLLPVIAPGNSHCGPTAPAAPRRATRAPHPAQLSRDII